MKNHMKIGKLMMDLEHCKVLVLDDELQLGEMLVKTLKAEKMNAVAVTEVDAAIQKLKEEQEMLPLMWSEQVLMVRLQL